MLITHIDQVLPLIAGRDDFVHAVKDGYQVIDYLFEDNDSFSDPIRAECRGLKFDAKGNIIGRPFHKFFNYGQKLLTYDWSQPHRIMTKLDGSMVHTAVINDRVRLCTRMGLTEQAALAEEHTPFNFLLVGPLKEWCDTYTFIFEFTSPMNRIVIEYDKPQLTLLAIRHTRLGYYLPEWQLKQFAFYLKVPVVESHQFVINDSSIEELRRTTTGIEGFVVAWADGTYVKIKGDEYTQMHRAVSFFDREDMILPIVLDSQCDDLYPNLSVDRVARLSEYEAAVMKEFLEWIEKVRIVSDDYFNDVYESRKDYAQWVNNYVPQALRAAFFSAADGKDIKEAVRNCILRNPSVLTVRW